MVVILLVYLLAIFIFVFPFPMDLNAFFSLNNQKAGSNFRLGFYTIDISVKVGAEGIEIYGLKPAEKKAIDSHKKRIELFYDPRLLKSISIDSINLIFQYGNSNDALNTSIICSAIDNLSIQLHRAFHDKIKNFRKVILAEYNKDNLFFQLRIDIKINLFIIFSTLFKIILLKLAKKISRGGNAYE